MTETVLENNVSNGKRQTSLSRWPQCDKRNGWVGFTDRTCVRTCSHPWLDFCIGEMGLSVISLLASLRALPLHAPEVACDSPDVTSTHLQWATKEKSHKTNSWEKNFHKVSKKHWEEEKDENSLQMMKKTRKIICCVATVLCWRSPHSRKKKDPPPPKKKRKFFECDVDRRQALH